MDAGASAQEIGGRAEGAGVQRRYVGLRAEIVAQIFCAQEHVARQSEFRARSEGGSLDGLVRRTALIRQFRRGIGIRSA